MSVDFDEIMMTDIDDQTIADPSVTTKVKRPSMYNVVLLNDDFTPMDFVTQILTDIFSHSMEDAMAIMLEVHHYGRAVAGTFTKEIATEKSEEAMKLANINEFPLVTTVEEVPYAS